MKTAEEDFIVRISITTPDGVVLDILEVYGDEHGNRPGRAVLARKIVDHIGERFMLEPD